MLRPLDDSPSLRVMRDSLLLQGLNAGDLDRVMRFEQRGVLMTAKQGGCNSGDV